MPFLGYFLNSTFASVTDSVSCAHVVWLILLVLQLFCHYGGWRLIYERQFFFPFFILMVLSGRIYNISGRYSNFYVYCAKFQEENCRWSTSKIEFTLGNIMDSSYALFVIPTGPKTRGKKIKTKQRERGLINSILNVIF